MDELSPSQAGSCHDRAGARSSQTGGCAGAFFNMFDWTSSKRTAAGRPNSEAVYARTDHRSFSERACHTTTTLPTNDGPDEAFSGVKCTPSPSPAPVKSDDTSKRVPGVVARLMGLESLPHGTDSSLRSDSQYAHSTAGSERLQSLQELLRPEFHDPEKALQEKFPQSPLLSPTMLGGMKCLLDDALNSLELRMQPSPRSQEDAPNESRASFRSERKITTPSHGRAGSLSNSSTKSPRSVSKPGHTGQLLAETRASSGSQSSRKSGDANRRHFEMTSASSIKSPSPNRARASNSKRVESSPRALSITDGRKQGEALTMKRTNSPLKRSPFQKPNPAPALVSSPSTSQINVCQIRKPWRKVNAEESRRESSLVSCGSSERTFGQGLSKPLPPLSPDFSSFDSASPIISSEVFGSGPTFPSSPLVNYEKCFFSSRSHLNLQDMVEVVSGNRSNDQDAAAQLNTCSSSAVCEIQRTSVDPEDVMMTSPASKKVAHDHLYADVSCGESCTQPSPVSVLANPFLDEGPTTPDDKQERDIGGEWNRVSSYKQASPLLSEDLKVSGFSYGISGDISEETSDKGEEALIMKHTDSAFMRPPVATNSFSQWNVKAFPDLSKAIKAVEEQFKGFDSQSGSDCLPIEQIFGARGFSKSNVAALSTTPDFSCFTEPALETSSEAFVSGPGTFPSSPLIMYEKMF